MFEYILRFVLIVVGNFEIFYLCYCRFVVVGICCFMWIDFERDFGLGLGWLWCFVCYFIYILYCDGCGCVLCL